MDARENVLVDLSGLNYEDARFIGTLMTSMYFAAAHRRPPMRCARHRLMLDEAESLITTVVSRMVDQTAKWGLNIDAAIQRLGQIRAKGEFIADALFGNCAVKICFGGLEPESARYMTELLYGGFVNMQEYKPDTARPIAVGQERQVVANWSRSEMQAVSAMRATSRSHAFGHGRGTFTGNGTSSGSGAGTGESYGQVLTPPLQLLGPTAPNASFIPVPLSQSVGQSSSQNAFDQNSVSSGETHSEFEVHGGSETEAHGTSRGTGYSEGGSECFTTVYEWSPSELYTLEEQLFRLTGQLQSLARRHCIVKIEDQRPFESRTVDLTPPFRCEYFRTHMLPLFLANCAKRSPYIRSSGEVDAEIAARLLPPQPAADDTIENEPWRETFDYPDPPAFKPRLRLVTPTEDGGSS